MEDILVIAVILLIIGLAVWYVVRSRRRGRRCIGCPEDGCDGCQCHCEAKKK